MRPAQALARKRAGLEPLVLYTVAVRPSIASGLSATGEAPDELLASAAAAIEAVVGERKLIVFPAGLVCVTPAVRRSEVAERLFSAAARAGAAVIFGVDQAPPGAWEPLAGPARPYLFACDGAERRLWDVEAGSDRRDLTRPATVSLAGRRVGVLAGAEVFNRGAQKRLLEERPDLIAVLTHAGPTDRWAHALGLLARVAPVVASGGPEAHSGAGPGARQWIVSRAGEHERAIVLSHTWRARR